MKNMLVFNAVMFTFICIGNYFYITNHSLLVKTLTSLLFVLVGLGNGVYKVHKNKKYKCYSVSMILALTFAMLGDVVLELDFVSGAMLFAIGHITFVVAYSFLQRYQAIDCFAGSLIFTVVGLFILYSEHVKIPDLIMKWICMGYALIIALMAGKAISNSIRQKNLTNLIVLLGSILFLISDFMLLLDLYVRTISWTGEVCLATYYPAEFLLAFSILTNGISLKKNKK